MVFQYRHGRRWFHAEASFSLEKLDVEQLYKDVQLLNRLFSKANGKWYFRTAKDGGGSTQQRVCPANSKLKNVQGCTFFSDAILGSSGRIVSIFLQVTRTLYFLVQCSCQGAVQKLQFLDSFLRFRCDV